MRSSIKTGRGWKEKVEVRRRGEDRGGSGEGRRGEGSGMSKNKNIG
jgi:hypothetical protein